MGPNGSGKTSLAYALLGHPDYKVDAGDITWQGVSLLKLSPDKRARAGMFLAFQYPSAIPGVTVASFLRNIYNAVHHPRQPDADGDGAAAIKYTGIPLAKFRKLLEEKMQLLNMDPAFATRYVNDGFSGGEKKRLEMLQLAIQSPEDGDPGRDRLRARHRRAAERGRGDQRHPVPRHGRVDDHPLPAHAELREAAVRPRPARRTNRDVRAARSCRASSRPTATTGFATRWACPPTRPMKRPPSRWPRERTRPMSVGAEPAVIPGAFSGTERRADFPVFERPTGSRQPPRVPRRGRLRAQAAGRHRRHGRRLRPSLRQRPPRHLRAERGRHPALRGRAPQGHRLPRRAVASGRSSSSATRPRPSTWSPTRGAVPTSPRAT